MRPMSFALAMVMAPISIQASAGTPPNTETAPPVAGCDPIAIGPVYDVSIEVTSRLECFQLVTPDDPGRPKLDVNFAGFHADELHDVSLVRVDPDSSTHAIATDSSTDAFRVVQAIGPPSTRWLILVGRTTSGTVSQFQLQATVAYDGDRYEPNDTIAKASVLRGNQRIEANLDNAADADHYLIIPRADQKQTIVEFDTAAGVTAKLIDGVDQTHMLQAGRPIRMDSSHPIFLSVSGIGAIDAGARYSLRTRDPNAFAVVSRIHSNERISHLAPGFGLSVPGGANAARSLEVEATVFEGDGKTTVGAGQRVAFHAYDVEKSNSWLLTSTEIVTNDDGIARATLAIGACKGGVRGPVRMHTPSNRPEYWDISYNPESIVLAMLPGNEQRLQPTQYWIPFQHVCKEAYRGYRP